MKKTQEQIAKMEAELAAMKAKCQAELLAEHKDELAALEKKVSDANQAHILAKAELVALQVACGIVPAKAESTSKLIAKSYTFKAEPAKAINGHGKFILDIIHKQKTIQRDALVTQCASLVSKMETGPLVSWYTKDLAKHGYITIQ